MANSRGLGAASFLDGALRGYSTVKNFQAQDKANAIQDEQLGYAREDRAHQVDERARVQKDREREEDQRDRLTFADFETQREKDPDAKLDPALWDTRVGKGLRQQLDAFDADETDRVIKSVMGGEIGLQDPAVQKVADGLFAGEFSARKGKVLDRSVRLSDGSEAPAGSVIENAGSSGFYPMAGGRLAPEMRLTVRTPDGRTGEYFAPATKDGSTADDAEVIGLPVQTLFDRAKRAKRMKSLIAQGYIRAGGKREDLAPKQVGITKTYQVQKGSKVVTYGLKSDGSSEKLGEGDKFDPGLAQYRDRVAGAAELNARSNATRASRTGLPAARGASSTALMQNVEFIAGIMFNGDKAKAARYIKSSDPTAAIGTATNAILKQQTDGGVTKGDPGFLTREQAAVEAAKSINAARAALAAEEAGEMNGGGSGAATDFSEGEVYEDADGNRATYSNGEFVPVE